MTDEELKTEAEAVLRDGGCGAIRVEGAGENWHVWCGYGPGQFFVSAFSAKCATTPNDPVYLARQALATLERNERPAWLARMAEAVENAGVAADASPAFDTEGAGGGEAPVFTEADDDATAGAEDRKWGDTEPNDADSDGDRMERVETQDDLRGVGEDVGELGGAQDLAPDATLQAELADEPEPLPESGAESIIISGDTIDRIGMIKLGLVAMKAAQLIQLIRAGADEQPDEFRLLQSHVLAHTIDGVYKGEQEAYSRFVRLSEADNAARTIDIIRAGLTHELTEALSQRDRAFVEAFDPDEGWPE